MWENGRNISFDVDAYTARLIGRENVSKIEGAILELAKNAYDADASAVCIYYDDSWQVLLMMDNGEGMTEDIIRKHWMTIGNSSKKTDYVSRRGRIKTGAKGIGRFALDRISDRCQMWTSTGASSLVWDVSWNDFSDNRKISEVQALLYDTDESLLSFAEIDSWKNQPMAELLSRPEYNFHDTGTVFWLSALHDDWSEPMQERIRRHLSNLLPPEAVDNFKIFFFNGETSPENAEVHSNSVEQFDYKIMFQVRSGGEDTGSVLQIQLIRNEFDVLGRLDLEAVGFSEEDASYFAGEPISIIRPLAEVVSQPEGRNLIGDIEGTLYFNKVSTTDRDQRKYFYKDFTGRKNFTKEFGGIKVYRDHFRVRPYGEYGDNDFDWLELSARRNRQPGAISHKGRWRVGSEQIMGIVSISRQNRNLEDDANRNGLQDGPGFLQFKEILLAVIDEFERDRQYVGRKLDEYDKEQQRQQRELEDLARLAEQRRQWEAEREQNSPPRPSIPPASHSYFEERAPAANPVQVKKLIDDILEDKEQEIQELRDELKMLRTLATTGIITNQFMHEIRTLTNNIGMYLDASYEALVLDDDPPYAVAQILHAVDSKKHFASWFDLTIGAIQKDKRRRRVFFLGKELAEFVDAWQAVLRKSGVTLEFHCTSQLTLRCFMMDIENILNNLISNSVTSFERESEIPLSEKRITISLTPLQVSGIRIDYLDTGWGLSDMYKKYPERTLEPFETDKRSVSGGLDEDGTGMGMWIIQQIVADYRGSIDLSDNKTRKCGYHAIITLGGSDA